LNTEAQIRLSKRMSELGLCSRREADDWIERGLVSVNGERAGLGEKVSPHLRAAQISIAGKARAESDARVTVLIHKPVGYVSGQAEDGYLPALTLVQAQSRWSEDRNALRFDRSHLKSLVPAGRLDIDSTGLLVLTQDGRIAKHLIGEDSQVEKEYLVRVSLGTQSKNVERQFSAELLARLNFGLSLDNEPLRPAQVSWQNPEQLRFVLKQGKKRQIRRMCDLVGLHVTGLKRVRIGRVKLGLLPQGQWRYLAIDEVF
jgi:23S rRNA pseudouridine2604 synthase